jgi:hypothetical protein
LQLLVHLAAPAAAVKLLVVLVLQVAQGILLQLLHLKVIREVLEMLVRHNTAEVVAVVHLLLEAMVLLL